MIEVGDLVRFRNSKIRPTGPYARCKRGKRFRGVQEIMRAVEVSPGPGNLRYVLTEASASGRTRTVLDCDLVVYRKDPKWAEREQKRRARRKHRAFGRTLSNVDEIHDFLDELRNEEQQDACLQRAEAGAYQIRAIQSESGSRIYEIQLLEVPPAGQE